MPRTPEGKAESRRQPLKRYYKKNQIMAQRRQEDREAQEILLGHGLMSKTAMGNNTKAASTRNDSPQSAGAQEDRSVTAIMQSGNLAGVSATVSNNSDSEDEPMVQAAADAHSSDIEALLLSMDNPSEEHVYQALIAQKSSEPGPVIGITSLSELAASPAPESSPMSTSLMYDMWASGSFPKEPERGPGPLTRAEALAYRRRDADYWDTLYDYWTFTIEMSNEEKERDAVEDLLVEGSADVREEL